MRVEAMVCPWCAQLHGCAHLRGCVREGVTPWTWATFFTMRGGVLAAQTWPG